MIKPYAMKRFAIMIGILIAAALSLSSCGIEYVAAEPEVIVYEDPRGYTNPELLWLLRYNAYRNRYYYHYYYSRPTPPPPPKPKPEPRPRPEARPQPHNNPPANHGGRIDGPRPNTRPQGGTNPPRSAGGGTARRGR